MARKKMSGREAKLRDRIAMQYVALKDIEKDARDLDREKAQFERMVDRDLLSFERDLDKLAVKEEKVMLRVEALENQLEELVG